MANPPEATCYEPPRGDSSILRITEETLLIPNPPAWRKIGSLTFGVGKLPWRDSAHGAEVSWHSGTGFPGGCSALADSVWTKRECRKRAWGQSGDNSLSLQNISSIVGKSCPRIAPTHSPFAHTPPREAAADCGRLRRNSNRCFTKSGGCPTWHLPTPNVSSPQFANGCAPLRRSAAHRQR